MLSVEIVFILLLFVSLPNLFYRAEFNVPLLLFVAACWNNYKSTSAYLLLISWFLQLYRIIILVTYQDNATLNNQRQPFLIIITISAFVLKIFLIIYLIVKEEQFRNALKPSGILMNIYNSFLTKQPENQL